MVVLLLQNPMLPILIFWKLTIGWISQVIHKQVIIFLYIFDDISICYFLKIVGSPTKSVKTPVEPNYSGINIEPEATKAPPKSGDIFGDLLGSQGYTFSSKFNPGPKTINEMRREDLVKEIDPEKLKVYKIFYLIKLISFVDMEHI